MKLDTLNKEIINSIVNNQVTDFTESFSNNFNWLRTTADDAAVIHKLNSLLANFFEEVSKGSKKLIKELGEL